MHEPENPFNRLYVPETYDDTVIVRKTEISSARRIVTDFKRDSQRIVAQDTVIGSYLQSRATYDETSQQCTELHTPTQTQYFNYDERGRLHSVLSSHRPLALD